MPLSRGLNCPTLITLGGQEVQTNMAFQGLPEELQNHSGQHRTLEVALIPDADHFYTGVRGDLVECIDRWLRATLPTH